MRLGSSVGLAVLGLACEEPSATTPGEPTEPSPNASILPAPLAKDVAEASGTQDAGTALDASIDASSSQAGLLRADRPSPREGLVREPWGVRLGARFRWLDLPPFPRLPHVNGEALERLRDDLAFNLELELSFGGRLRARLDSDAFTLPRGSELRSRIDYLGHFLVWDYGSKYTVLPLGTLRAVLNEHRADAAPLIAAKVAEQGHGSVLGLRTDKTELSTPLGRLLLEQARVTSVGAGAVLLCRLLVDILAADPRNAPCASALLPLRAELWSAGGGHLLFEALKLEREQDFQQRDLSAPPSDAHKLRGQLPALGRAVVPNARKLTALRLRPAGRTERPEPSAPDKGLLVHNRGESLRYLLLDGVVVARIPPRGEVSIEGLLPGKYGLLSLDFLGADPSPLKIIELPARVDLGEEPADQE